MGRLVRSEGPEAMRAGRTGGAWCVASGNTDALRARGSPAQIGGTAGRRAHMGIVEPARRLLAVAHDEGNRGPADEEGRGGHLPPLVAVLAGSALGKTRLLTTARGGDPITSPKSLAASMKRWCVTAGIPKCSIHALRKALAVRDARGVLGPQRHRSLTHHPEIKVLNESVDVGAERCECNHWLIGRTGLHKKRLDSRDAKQSTVSEHLLVDASSSQMKVLPAAILAMNGLDLVAPLLAAIVFGFVGLFLTWLIKYHPVGLRLLLRTT